MAPNEFQSHLRQAMTAVAERARANKVKLPENFFLGFDEFASALPNTAVAPLLGQQLAQIELLLNILIDARVDVTAFRRTPLPEEHPTSAAPPGPTAAGRTKAGSGDRAEIDRAQCHRSDIRFDTDGGAESHQSNRGCEPALFHHPAFARAK